MSRKKIFVIMSLIIIVIVVTIIIILKKNDNYEEDTQKLQELTLYDTNLSEYVKETEEGIKINTSTELNQKKSLGELSVSGIQLTSKSGIMTLIATATNNSSSDTSLKNFEVVLLNKEGEEIATAKGVVKSLKVGESTKINISMSSNGIRAYNLKFREL